MHRFLSSKIRQTQSNVFTSVMRSNRFSSSVPEDLVTKLAFVGGGQMAEAILNSVIKDKVQSTRNIHIYDTNFERVKYLAEKYDITPSYDVQSCVDKAEIVVVAVKPQNIDELAESLETPPEGLILSIVAGCTISNLRNKFRTKKIMRTMPNTPSMIAEGITVWTTTKETSKELRDKGEKLISSIGDQVQVSNEKYLDMATAISGSGPAYVFLTMEAMIDAAVHMGFPREIATKLVLATLRGSSSYALQSHVSVHTLKSNVTSPAGTTASALYELERGGYRTVVADAVWAAYRKALELGGQSSKVGPGRYKH